MPSSPAGRFAALMGAAILAVGGLSLWFSADSQSAGATTTPSPADLPAPSIDTALEAPLTADPPKPKNREEQRFARADKDDDGRITQAEYLQQRRRNFEKLDMNGDGRLGFEEYAVAGIKKFGSADSDDNGALIPAEFATTAPKPKNRQTASAEPCRCPPQQTAGASDGEPQD